MTKPTKPTSSGPGKGKQAGSGSSKAPATKAPGTKVGAAKAGAGAGKRVMTPAERAAANRAQSKKIVNKRQTPWGLIVTTVVIVVLAVGVIAYAVNKGQKKSNSANPDKINGIVHVTGLTRNHVSGVVKYAQSPPIGGDHSPIWADCTGTVYPKQIANENAVHDLEHGAVWITYKPGLPAAQLDVLTKLVSGNQYMLLTPYAGLKTNVSLQAWGYQLFVNSASDARVQTFINDLLLNQSNTPEYGASCTNAAFKTTPSTPGHPIDS